MTIIEKKISELTPYENNPRKNDKSIDAVANSISTFGFKVPIIIDKHNIIVAGHTRYKAAIKIKMESVPCIIADDLTDEQIKAFRLVDNKAGEASRWDIDMLANEIASINIDINDFGFDELIKDTDNEEIALDLDNDDQHQQKIKICHCPKCGYEFGLEI